MWSQARQRREKLDKLWMTTCIAAISEQLESETFSDQVCGIVVSVRKNQDRLAVWIRSGTANESAVLAVGNRWKNVLELRGQSKIGFQVHSESMKPAANNSAINSSGNGTSAGGSGSFPRGAQFVV